MEQDTQTQQPQQEQQKSQEQQEDLITRVAKMAIESESKEDDKFNINEIEKIEDPQARGYASKAYKSLEKGYTKKFQEVAELRKDYERKLDDLSTWSPEKVQTLLNNPDFVKAAQQIAGVQNQEGYSDLSAEEQKRFDDLNKQMNALQTQYRIQLKNTQDEVLKEKYPDYNPDAVDIITNDLLSGKRQATREDLWKVEMYDKHLQRAYELGKKDRQLDIHDKLESSAYEEGTQAHTEKTEPIKPKEGERDEDYFTRIYRENYQKLKKQGVVK